MLGNDTQLKYMSVPWTAAASAFCPQRDSHIVESILGETSMNEVDFLSFISHFLQQQQPHDINYYNYNTNETTQIRRKYLRERKKSTKVSSNNSNSSSNSHKKSSTPVIKEESLPGGRGSCEAVCFPVFFRWSRGRSGGR